MPSALPNLPRTAENVAMWLVAPFCIHCGGALGRRGGPFKGYKAHCKEHGALCRINGFLCGWSKWEEGATDALVS